MKKKLFLLALSLVFPLAGCNFLPNPGIDDKDDGNGGNGGGEVTNVPTLTLEPSATMYVGDSLQLIYTANGIEGGTVYWTSSDESVVTVENGVAEALKAGVATITAAYGTLEKSCVITVSNKVVDQKEQALYDSYVGYAKDVTANRELEKNNKEYIVQVAHEVYQKNIDVTTVVDYLPVLIKAAKDDGAYGVFDSLVTLKNDNLLDDLLYYAVGFGKVLLKVESVDDEYAPETLGDILTIVERETDNLNTKLLPLAEAVLNIYEEVTKASFLQDAVNVIGNNGLINAIGLQSFINKLPPLFEEVAKMEEGFCYVLSLAQEVFPLCYFTDENTFVYDIVAMLNVNAIGKGFFDVIDFIGDGLAKLDSNYYDYVASLTEFDEQAIYAILGAIEIALKDVVLTKEQIEAFAKGVVDFAGDVIDVLFKNEIVDENAKAIVDNENTLKVLKDLGVLVMDVFNEKLDFLSAKEIVEMVRKIRSISVNGFGESGDLTYPDFIPSALGLLFDEYGESAPSAEDEYDSLIVFSKTEIQYSEEENEFHVINMYVEFYDGNHYYYYVETTNYSNIEVIPEIVYGILNELVTKEEFSATICGDLFELLDDAFNLYGDIIDLYGFEDVLPSVVGSIIEFISSNNELAIKTVQDLFVVLRDLVSAFLTIDELEADIDFARFFIEIMNNKFDIEDISLSEERFAGVKALLRDVYEILVEFELLDPLCEMLEELLSLQTEITFKTSDEFADFFYDFVFSMFGIQEEEITD